MDALMGASRVLVAQMARSLGELDLTLPQYRILVVLASRAPLRTVGLAGELGVTPSTATRNSVCPEWLPARSVVSAAAHPTPKSARKIHAVATAARRTQLRRVTFNHAND